MKIHGINTPLEVSIYVEKMIIETWSRKISVKNTPNILGNLELKYHCFTKILFKNFVGLRSKETNTIFTYLF